MLGWVVTEPSSPPTEGAVSRDEVLALSHQPKIVNVGGWRIESNNDFVGQEMEAIGNPLGAVAEDKKARAGCFLREVIAGPSVVVRCA